ncbi:hypothetical protein BDV59DRAFT_205618 [Aspergillus ambiguus]|uniref:uncharacterized protein n=1 Tax=Aspergillus ambiguus TaxID=176160 RepID=UPI003CCDD5EC
MEADVLERLKNLQLADLGSRRREHISTVDSRRPKATASLPDIEANRCLAARNEPRLDGWNNVHKTIGDTEDLENLSSLNSGQSHRANLAATIRPNGHQPSRFPPPPANIPRSSKTGTKRKNVEPLEAPRQHPASARSVSARFDTGKEKAKSDKKCSYKPKATSSTVSRQRRPMGDFSSLVISPPEESLHCARQIYNDGSSLQNTQASNDDSSVSRASAIAKAVTPKSLAEAVSPPVVSSKAAVAVPSIKVGILLDFDAPEDLPSKDLEGLCFRVPGHKPNGCQGKMIYSIQNLLALRPSDMMPQSPPPESFTTLAELAESSFPKPSKPEASKPAYPNSASSKPNSVKPLVSASTPVKTANAKPVHPGTPNPAASKENTPKAFTPHTPKSKHLRPEAVTFELPEPTPPKQQTPERAQQLSHHPHLSQKPTLSIVGNHLLPGRGGKKAFSGGLESSIYAN